MQEEWRDVVGYEGLYQVSNYGRVKSLGRVVERKNGRPLTVKERILKAGNGHGGHKVVAFSVDGEIRSFQVHCLVLEAFVGPRPAEDGVRWEACHWDGDPSNNAAENLRWDTAKENSADRIRHKTTGFKITPDQAEEILLACKSEEYAAIADRFGISKVAVCAIAKGQAWAHIRRDIPRTGRGVVRGERVTGAKLMPEDVIEIRRLCESMKQKDVAEMFSIDQSAVSNIIRRRNWKHIP